MKKFLKITSLVIVLIMVAVFFKIKHQLRDRHPGYHFFHQIEQQSANQIQAGFSALSVTPEIVDTWNDIDGNSKYEPEKGDTYNDNNNNGEFDAYWIAGFHSKRAANGIHDPLWARTMVIDDGKSRVAIVVIDAIGLFHDQTIEIRERLSKDLNIDYCMVFTTHVHESPDLMGIWGESHFKSGVNEEYMELVISQAARSVEQAVKDLEPVSLHFSQNENSAQFMVKDTRKPIVHDPGMYIIHVKDKNGATKGTLISWANHPETVWSDNLLITSDFPHYLREGVEKELGGTCVYINGAIGGLMTTHPSLGITDPETGKEIKEAGFEKAELQGRLLTEIAMNTIQNSTDSISSGSIGLQAKTFTIPFSNKMFRLAAILGILDRGMTEKWEVRTEMAAFNLGPASFLTVPGEIYPELVNGGIVAPEGQDIQTGPVEIPPLREMMQGQYKFVFGLANDELGYIIPKSEWDNEEPWLWHSERDFYGEENSAGPETAPIIHQTAKELLTNLYN